MPATAKAARERWSSQFEPFWVPGLAFFCLLVSHAVFHSPLFWRWMGLPLLPLLLVSPLAAIMASSLAVGDAAASLRVTAASGFAIDP